MAIVQTRRRILSTIAWAGAASLVYVPRSMADEGRLETTSIRLAKLVDMCTAPQFVADELLRAEGFTDVQYVPTRLGGIADAVGHDKVDLSLVYVPQLIVQIGKGDPITILAGVMVGCIEVFAREDIHSITDLKGRSIGVIGLGSSQQGNLSVMAAYVGLDPAKDIRWVDVPLPDRQQFFLDGKIDALLSVPPESQELRAQKIGHVIVNTAVDRPWSQYFCCMLAGNREFVQKHPVATKRALRAILKAADLCVSEPQRSAQGLVDRGFTPRYDYAVQALDENVFKWREYDAEDTVRFYALRLHDVGFIKSSPQQVLAESTDWRFLNELKRELKA
jgi:NitT/TauT family transport system substrate-binding protein